MADDVLAEIATAVERGIAHHTNKQHLNTVDNHDVLLEVAVLKVCSIALPTPERPVAHIVWCYATQTAAICDFRITYFVLDRMFTISSIHIIVWN